MLVFQAWLSMYEKSLTYSGLENTCVLVFQVCIILYQKYLFTVISSMY